MKSTFWVHRVAALPVIALFLSIACTPKKSAPVPDHPRLTPLVTMHDATFRSTALGRDIQYRVVLPAVVPSGKRLPVVYLLHGGGGGYRDWTNYSDVAKFAGTDRILVMPEGDDSYYTDAARRSADRYEDYLTTDLIADVEGHFSAAPGRANRAIVGVSMGGFGAVKLALKRPDLYAFAAGISPALDVPSRPFSIKRPLQWRYHRSIFGPWGGRVQQENDPFVLARSVDPTLMPYLFITCGDQEGLLAANRKFAAVLGERHFQFEFHIVRGGHDWTQWNAQLASCFQRLIARLAVRP